LIDLPEEKLEEIQRKMNELCHKVNKRIEELGNVDMMTYRSDPVIKELQSEICRIYRKAVAVCKTYGEASKICKIFMKEPNCLTQLMLSEEVACPVGSEE